MVAIDAIRYLVMLSTQQFGRNDELPKILKLSILDFDALNVCDVRASYRVLSNSENIYIMKRKHFKACSNAIPCIELATATTRQFLDLSGKVTAPGVLCNNTTIRPPVNIKKKALIILKNTIRLLNNDYLKWLRNLATP